MLVCVDVGIFMIDYVIVCMVGLILIYVVNDEGVDLLFDFNY